MDAEVLAGVLGAWLADRNGPNQRRRAVAVDGKTLRGAKRDGRQVHLLAAMEHATRRVLAQREVGGAPGEVPGFQPLLADVDLAGVLVTADALQTHAEAAEFLVSVKQANYLFAVKVNQPTLLDHCACMPWQQVPELDRTRDHAHGRVEIRTLKAISVRGFGVFPARRPGHPGHPQGPRPSRPVVADHGRLRDHQPALPAGQPRPPGRLPPRPLPRSRTDCTTFRDVTFGEDASQARTGFAPQAMAALRNLVVGVLCRAGPVNLAAELRYHSRNPHRPPSESARDEPRSLQSLVATDAVADVVASGVVKPSREPYGRGMVRTPSRGGSMGLSSYRMNAFIAVTDMTRAEEFYEGQLGLPVVRTDADGSKVYASGGVESLVVYPSPDHAGRSTATLVAWYVDDVEQVVDELTSNGVTFEQYEGVLESGFDYGTDDKGISPRAGGGKVAWFKDPDGNLFSIEGDR